MTQFGFDPQIIQRRIDELAEDVRRRYLIHRALWSAIREAARVDEAKARLDRQIEEQR